MDIQCQYCKAELEADENYYGEICPCPSCGEKISIPNPLKNECPFCGEIIFSTACKCKHCGEILLEESDNDPTKSLISRFLKVFQKK